MDLGDILVMPVTGTRTRAWDAYRSHFPKDKAAAPGYYTVELSDPQVKAELTASIHAAPASIYLQQKQTPLLC